MLRDGSKLACDIFNAIRLHERQLGQSLWSTISMALPFVLVLTAAAYEAV